MYLSKDENEKKFICCYTGDELTYLKNEFSIKTSMLHKDCIVSELDPIDQ